MAAGVSWGVVSAVTLLLLIGGLLLWQLRQAQTARAACAHAVLVHAFWVQSWFWTRELVQGHLRGSADAVNAASARLVHIQEGIAMACAPSGIVQDVATVMSLLPFRIGDIAAAAKARDAQRVAHIRSTYMHDARDVVSMVIGNYPAVLQAFQEWLQSWESLVAASLAGDEVAIASATDQTYAIACALSDAFATR